LHYHLKLFWIDTYVLIGVVELSFIMEKPVNRAVHLLSFVLLTLFAAATAHAQIAGELKGRVSDPAGAAISNAHVELIQIDTQVRQQTSTTGDGYFVFTQLNAVRYDLHVVAPGFAVLDRKGITVALGQTASLQLALNVGSDTQSVVVNEDAPLLQAQTSNIQTNISGSEVSALPLNSRNFINLTQLAPGVELPPGTLLPRINGGRPRTNEYLFDGISALQPEPGQVAYFPIIDSIQEFTVEADNVPAEFGRFNGGVVNVSTKSGTNAFHGSLFEYFRNEDLNARNYFTTLPTPKPEYRKNLYGATLGTPLLRDRLFFFGDYQGIKQLIGRTIISTVPTCAERLGNFSGVAKIYDPADPLRSEFANDTINHPFDTAAQALLARIPSPTTNCTDRTNNYSRTANDADHQNQFDIRVDDAYGTKDRAFFRYTYYKEVEQPVTPFPDGSGAISGTVIGTGNVSGLSSVLGQQAVFNETHTFTPHLVQDLRLGYTRRGNGILGVSLGDTASAALGIPGIPTNAAFNNALPLFTFGGNYQQIGSSASTFAQYQTGVWQMVDTLLWTRGKHAIKAGLDFRWYQLNTISPSNPTGSFLFSTTGTDSLAAAGGDAFASFLLGQVDTFSIDLQQSKIRPRDQIQEFFVQDDWNVSPRLTVNIGARWTLAHPSTEKNNQGAIFNLQSQQLDYLGVNGYSRTARELHWGNVGPRVGLAWQATQKTVVRAGYGIVFIDQSGITTPFTTPQFPFIQTVTQPTLDSINSPFTLSDGPTVAPIAHTADAGLGQSVYTAKRTEGSGYVQQWNLAVQRSITNSLSIDLAYVGSHIVHVGIPDANMNQLTPQQLAIGSSLTTKVSNPYYGTIPVSSTIGRKTITNAQLLKPYPRFQNIATYRNNSGTTNYNAAELKVEERLSHGLTFIFAYTHSKLIDDASSVFSSTVFSAPGSNSIVAADTFNPRLERDSSTGDMPNVTSLGAVYQLPAGRNHRFASSGVQNLLLGGWTLNGIMLLQSGMPVAITDATNQNSGFGFALQRPTVSGNPNLPPAQRTVGKTGRYFNTAAFTPTKQFLLGNASRNPVRGPAYRDLDMALIKHTTLPGKADMEFRAEVFNVTNTPQFGQPNGSCGATAFGTITTTSAEQRVAQFAIRLSR